MRVSNELTLNVPGLLLPLEGWEPSGLWPALQVINTV